MYVCARFASRPEQNPGCINPSNAQELVSGTVDGVIQPPSVFNFMNGFFMFDVFLPAGGDAEFCVLFDPTVSFGASNAISEAGYDIKLVGGLVGEDTG